MKPRFKKIYIEISNICNLQCSFCPEVERVKTTLAANDFQRIAEKIQGAADEVCLHLMGEPLAHPELANILQVCIAHQLQVNLTTNGTLLRKQEDLLLGSTAVRQINFSLHSFNDNFPNANLDTYLLPIFAFALRFLDASSSTHPKYVNFRLWNLESDAKASVANEIILQKIEAFYQVALSRTVDPRFKKYKKIIPNLNLHFDSRFQWPNLKDPNLGELGHCYGLSHQIAVHANGEVVPCCLDKEAKIPLGNLLGPQNLEEIFNSQRAVRIREGFAKGIATEALCQSCTFKERFKKH